jgi:hypothetical protein
MKSRRRLAMTKEERTEACAFIAREASAKIKEDRGGRLAEDLKEVSDVYNEKDALGANTTSQTIREPS